MTPLDCVTGLGGGATGAEALGTAIGTPAGVLVSAVEWLSALTLVRGGETESDACRVTGFV
jgi:hypothetical protein